MLRRVAALALACLSAQAVLGQESSRGCRRPDERTHPDLRLRRGLLPARRRRPQRAPSRGLVPGRIQRFPTRRGARLGVRSPPHATRALGAILRGVPLQDRTQLRRGRRRTRGGVGRGRLRHRHSPRRQPIAGRARARVVRRTGDAAIGAGLDAARDEPWRPGTARRSGRRVCRSVVGPDRRTAPRLRRGATRVAVRPGVQQWARRLDRRAAPVRAGRRPRPEAKRSHRAGALRGARPLGVHRAQLGPQPPLDRAARLRARFLLGLNRFRWPNLRPRGSADDRVAAAL